MHTIWIQQYALLDQEDSHNFLDPLSSWLAFGGKHSPVARCNRHGDVDFFINRDSAMAGLNYLFQQIVVKFRLNWEHEDVGDWRHCLFFISLSLSNTKRQVTCTCLTTFSCRSKVAPIIVTVSVFRSPPWVACVECIAINSFSSVKKLVIWSPADAKQKAYQHGDRWYHDVHPTQTQEVSPRATQ